MNKFEYFKNKHLAQKQISSNDYITSTICDVVPSTAEQILDSFYVPGVNGFCTGNSTTYAGKNVPPEVQDFLLRQVLQKLPDIPGSDFVSADKYPWATKERLGEAKLSMYEELGKAINTSENEKSNN